MMLWKTVVICLVFNWNSCFGEVVNQQDENGCLEQTCFQEKNIFLAKLFQLSTLPKSENGIVEKVLNPELSSPKSRGLADLFTSRTSLKNNRIHENRSKRSASTNDIDINSLKDNLSIVLWQNEKIIKEFSVKMNQLESLFNETNQELKVNIIPRLERLENLEKSENKTNSEINPSVNCKKKGQERFRKLDHLSEALYEDRDRIRKELSDWFRILIVCNIPINDRYGPKNETLLHIAAKADAVEIAKLLIENGADIEAKAEKKIQPLHLAAQNNSIQVLTLLLENEAQVDTLDITGYTPLHYTAETDAVEAAEILIEKQANVNASGMLGFSVLHRAAIYNSPKVLRLLIKHKAFIDTFHILGRAALHDTCNKDLVETARILLENGANLTITTMNGNTPLHVAAEENAIKVLQLLLEYKAPINIQNDFRETPLHQAAKQNHVNIVKILIQNGADINKKASYGWTSLHFAAEKKTVDVIKVLLENKVKALERNSNDETAYDVAKRVGCTECMALLKQYKSP